MFLTIFISFVSVSSSDVEGMTSSLTVDPFGPLMSSTTSSILHPMTSTISPSCSWPTPTILSLGLSISVFSAGPPGTKDEIDV